MHKQMIRVSMKCGALAAGVMAMSIGLIGAVQAQSVSVKPGLWASSTTGTVNGHKLPSIFDIKGALTPQQKSSLAAGMQQLGLPVGSPNLSCQETETFTLPKPQQTEQCTFTAVPSDATSGTIKMSCAGDMKGSGEGRYKVTGKTTATMDWRMEGTTQGAPIKVEQTTVYKWVQADCSQPPKGMDPALAEMLK